MKKLHSGVKITKNFRLNIFSGQMIKVFLFSFLFTFENFDSETSLMCIDDKLSIDL